MGKPPAVIIVARHGARLDAADKQWHLTSPTPYDPPLTYGGWTQSRSLGMRIGNILRAREEGSDKWTPASSRSPSLGRTEEEDEPGSASGKRKRKYRVVVHSSPFLRCVQTAIAVSAGIRQVRVGRVTSNTSALVEAGMEAESVTEGPNNNGKSLLRLDAFLGEWLTPDYFESITPPPGSVMMLASAKGELLRRGEKVEMAPVTPTRASLGYFPGGWNGSSLNRSTADGGAENISQGQGTPGAADATPSARARSGSYDVATGAAPRFGGQVLSKLSTAISPDPGVYVPPTPTYAISPSDPIPPGYVAHARDSCADIDYQWDSMREPRNWGNGGEYGEEWSTMHRRFRTGLSKMVDWYKSNDPSASKFSVSDSKDESEDDAETVLVLITHGAGCNALIGALTNRPALVDVGTSSLTMAVRKENPLDTKSDGSIIEVADEYDVKHVASNDHLRMTSSSFQAQPRQPSPRTLTNPPPYQRFGSISGPIVTSPSGIDRSSFRQSIQNLSTPRVSHNHSRSMFAGRSSSGLWGSSASDDADDFIPNFGDPSPAPKPPSTSGNDKPPQGTQPRPHNGLWNGSSTQDRDSGVKRRWTVVDRTL